MITNIVDHRKKRYRFKKINAVVEATWHDNRVKNADKVPSNGRGGPYYEEVEGVTLAAALAWANKFRNPVTLYLYDDGDGVVPIEFRAKLRRRRS